MVAILTIHKADLSCAGECGFVFQRLLKSMILLEWDCPSLFSVDPIVTTSTTRGFLSER